MLLLSAQSVPHSSQLRACSADVCASSSCVTRPQQRTGSNTTQQKAANHRQQSSAAGQPGATPSKRLSCVVNASAQDAAGGLPAREAAERRSVLLKYVREVQPALVEQFVEDGPPAVVAAMKNTITNMLGTLPPQFFTVTISTVGENMSQLMLSVMMTGYLFRNAQYRLELRNALGGVGGGAAATTPSSSSMASLLQQQQQQQLGGSSSSSSSSVLQRSQSAPQQGSVLDEEAYAPGVQKSRVQGDVLLWHKENGLETLEAVQYIELLEEEVARLRQQLTHADGQPQQQQKQLQQPQQGQQQQGQQQRLPPPAPGQQGGVSADGRQLPVPVSSSSSIQQTNNTNNNSSSLTHSHTHSSGPAGLLLLHEETTNELLEYLRGLDASSLADLTSCADSEVAQAMEAFVGRLMGTTDRDSLSRAGSDCTAQELAKVMFWLMIVGYTLRGLEVRWDMKASVLSGGGGAGGGLSCDNSHEAW